MITQDTRPLRIVFIYEYGQPNADWMMTSLVESLRVRLPGIRPTYIHGLFSSYRPGGLSLERLVNLLWVYWVVAFRLLFVDADSVLVRTAPPGIQLWAVFWARFRRIPVFCWLMDYHPEIEARQLDRRGFGRIARFVRSVDSALMPRFAAIVALDSAMAAFARMRAPGVEILKHPTWGATGSASFSPVCYIPGTSGGPLRLVYSGNLGAAHDLTTFATLLRQLGRKKTVQLFVIGASVVGEQRFRKLGMDLNIAIECHSRVPFAQLLELYHRWRIDAGVVLLTDESAGLVSPSKFSGYVNFKIPLIYIGPPGTNTAEVCSRFKGGYCLENNADSQRIREVSAALLNEGSLRIAAEGAWEAARYFAHLNADSLAELLAPRVRLSMNRECGEPAIVDSQT